MNKAYPCFLVLNFSSVCYSSFYLCALLLQAATKPHIRPHPCQPSHPFKTGLKGDLLLFLTKSFHREYIAGPLYESLPFLVQSFLRYTIL